MLHYNKTSLNSDYEIYTLKQLLSKSPQYGANESGKQRISIEEPRYIRITDIDSNGNLKDNIGVTAEVVEEKYFLNTNDILLARSGATVGKAFIFHQEKYDYKCFFAGYMIRFVVDTKKILPDYFFYYTQTKTYAKWKDAIQRASGQPNINAEEYKSLKIPLPPLHKQQEIVDKFNSAISENFSKKKEAKDLLNGLNKYLLNKLEITMPEKKDKMIFITNFLSIKSGRFDPYYYQKHFEDFEKQLKNGKYQISRLGLISDKITSGATPLSGSDAYIDKKSGIPFIRSGNININGYINFDNLLYIKPEIHNKKLRSSQLKKNDLLIAIVGATIGQVGLYIYEKQANVNQAIAVVRLKSSVLPEYAKEYLKSSIGQAILDRLKRPVARANINLDEIASIPLIIPPKGKQKEIANFFKDKREKAQQLRREAKENYNKTKIEIENMIIN